jgi:uncharacterized membrane protein YfcA
MLTLLGLLIGLAIGVTGVGGGVLTAPLLILFFHMPPGPGVGTALLFSTGVKILSAGMFTARRQVHGRTLLLLLAGGVPGAIAGPLLLQQAHLGQDRTQDGSHGCWRWLARPSASPRATACCASWTAPGPRRQNARWLPLFSFPIGLEVGFSSAGAGALGTVLLFNLDGSRAGQSGGHGPRCSDSIVSACAGGIHMAAGNWDADVLVKLLLGGIPGALSARNSPSGFRHGRCARPSWGGPYCSAYCLPGRACRKRFELENGLSYLRLLEAESIHILREVAAEFSRPVMLVLHRQGLVGDAAAGAEGVLPRQASVPAAARRHLVTSSAR